MSIIGDTRVEFNHGDEPEYHAAEGAVRAVFLEVDVNNKTSERQNYWTTMSPDEARELARELIAIADQYDRDAEENAKPKLPTEPGLYVNAKADPATAPIFRYSEFSGWTMKTETFAPHEFKTVEEWVSYINRYTGLKRLVVEP